MAVTVRPPNALKSKDSEAPERRRRPRKFGRLTLLKPIARGGMGEVFLATAGGIEGAERPCVVKMIRREHAQDQSFLARFFDEARIQAQLDHPGVAQVLEASTDPSGKPFVVVEHIEGRNLAEARQRAQELNLPLAWADALAITVSILEALAHVHERVDAAGRPLEIAHRDLSPQNIMLSYGGEVKLIDFGTARGENRRSQTVSGVVFAKPGYVAPEVANNTPGGPAADLYAAGIVLWELVAGRRFLSGDAKEHLASVAKGEKNPPALTQFVDIPVEVDTLIARLTATALQDRYRSAREALSDLYRLLKQAPALADGERGVRPRIAHLMGRLYPSEPARSRAEFARLVAQVRHAEPRQALVRSPEPPSSDETLPGTRYRMYEELSRGEVSVLHRAEHVDLGRAVALKLLSKNRCDNPESEARFRSEAKTLSKLRHPNLVHLHDFGIASDGRPYFAMELLEGQTVRALLEREGKVDYRRALGLGIQACRALEAVHHAGMIHRDIKPENLFLCGDGTLKLIDFGIAVPLGQPTVPVASEGTVDLHGTVEYMAPEQAEAGSSSERADLYALGVVLYELLTGSLPHVAQGALGALEAKRQLPEPPSKRAEVLSLPRALDQLLLCLLDPTPAKRPATASELRAALDRVLQRPETSRLVRRAGAAAGAVLTLALAFTLPKLLNRVALDSAESRHAVLSSPARAADENSSGSGPIARVTDIASAEPTAADAPSSEASTPNAKAPTSSAEAEVAAEAVASASDDPLEDEDTTIDQEEDTTVLEPGPEVARVVDLELERELGRLEDWLAKDRNVLALNRYRELAEQHPDDVRLLRGWAQAARKTQGWGEALKIAIRWASLDPSPKAQLQLARTQRSVGQRYSAIATLQRLLERAPDNREAQRLIRHYGGSRLALQP